VPVQSGRYKRRRRTARRPAPTAVALAHQHRGGLPVPGIARCGSLDQDTGGLAGARVLPDFRPDVSKQYLSAWRLAGIVALAYVLAAAVSPRAAWLRHPWAKLLINCGQNSLPVFCLSFVLSIGFVILVEGGQNLLLHIVVNVGVAVLCFAAWNLRQFKKTRTAAGAATPRRGTQAN